MENFNFEVLDDDCIEINGKVIDLDTVASDKLETMYQRYKKKSEDDEDLFSWEGYYAAATETIGRVIQRRKDNPDLERTPEDLLELSRTSEVGATITCPQCKNKFEKRNSQHLFCSNAKTQSGGNCKDRYWNIHDPKRRERMDNFFEEQYAE